MSDIFDQAREELRREKYENWVRKYGPTIGVISVLVVGAVGGVLWWRNAQNKAVEARSVLFDKVFLKTPDEEDVVGELAILEVGDDMYGVLARFQKAVFAARRGDIKQALLLYDALEEDNSVPSDMRDLARVRAGYLRIEQGQQKETLKSLDTPNGAFRFSTREILALTAFGRGDWETFEIYYEKSIADPKTPSSLSERLSALYAQSLSQRAGL